MPADPHLLPKDDPDHWLKCDGCGGLYARSVHKIGAVCPSSTCRYNNDGYLQTFETVAVPSSAPTRKDAAEVTPLTKFWGVVYHVTNGNKHEGAVYLAAEVEAAVARLRAEPVAVPAPTEAEKELAAIKKLAMCLRLEHLIGGDDLAKRSETIHALKMMEVVAALQIEIAQLKRGAVPAAPPSTPSWTFTEYGAEGKAVLVLTQEQASQIKNLLAAAPSAAAQKP